MNREEPKAGGIPLCHTPCSPPGFDVSKTMRAKTASAANRASASPTSEKRLPAATVLAEPSPDGQPVFEEAIRLSAYTKWEAAGRPNGDGVNFWVEAEQELSKAK